MTSEEASAAIQRIRDLHFIVKGEDMMANPLDYCDECRYEYPCLTIRAIEGTL